jgi:hypothetical protein
MAVFVTVFSWILIFQLESRLACRIRIRLADDDADLEQAFSTVQSMLVSRGCRLQNSALYKGKQQLEFFCTFRRNSICENWSSAGDAPAFQ